MVVVVLAYDIYTDCQAVSAYKLELITTHDDIYDYRHADMDGDGRDEIIQVNIDRASYGLFDVQGQSMIWQNHRMANHAITAVRTADLNRDNKCDVVELRKDQYGDSTWCEVYDWDGRLLCKTDAIHGINLNDKIQYWPSWDGTLQHAEVYDLDADGNNDLILEVSAGHDLRPRGIFAYRYPEGDLLWRFLCGGVPIMRHVEDVDGDRLADIFFSTFAPENGNNDGGISDSLGWVVRLAHDGRLVWKQALTPKYSGNSLVLTDLDDDGTFELFTNHLVGDKDSEETVLIVARLDLETGKPTHRFTMAHGNTLSFFPARVSRGHERCLLLSEGLILLGAELDTVRHRLLPGFRVGEVLDLDRDGFDEIIAFKQDSLAILDTALSTVFSCCVSANANINRICVYPAPAGAYSLATGPAWTLYLIDKSHLEHGMPSAKYTLYRPQLAISDRLLVAMTEYDWTKLGLIFALGLVISLVGTRFRLSSFTVSKTAKSSPTLSNLLMSLTAFSHGQTGSANLNRLAFLTKNVPDDDTVLEKFITNLHDSIIAFEQFTLKHLRDINSQVHKTGLKGVESGRLGRLTEKLCQATHALKRLDGAALRREAPEMKKQVPRLIDEMRAELRQARAVVRSHFQTNVVAEIDAVLTAARPELAAAGVEMPKVRVTGDITGRAFFQPVEFSTVMEELITNARMAMTESERKALEIEVGLEEEITIRIMDTGAGLAKKDFTRIFERGYTTKPDGGGFGLHYVSTTVSRYDGRIRVESSQPGLQTAILVTLARV